MREEGQLLAGNPRGGVGLRGGSRPPPSGRGGETAPACRDPLFCQGDARGAGVAGSVRRGAEGRPELPRGSRRGRQQQEVTSRWGGQLNWAA